MKRLALLLLVSLSLSPLQANSNLTAFQALEVAKKQVNAESRSRLVQIIGKKSAISVMPVEWAVLFFDPNAEQSGILVTIAGNSVIKVQDGYTQMDKFRLAAYKLEEVIDPKTLKVDSNKAVEGIERSSILNGLKLSSATLYLHKEGKAPMDPGIWEIVLYALPKLPPGKSQVTEVKIGTARVSAETGQVLELKIDLKKVQ